MKILKIQVGQEADYARKTVKLLRELLDKRKVFAPQPEEGTEEYNRQALLPNYRKDYPLFLRAAAQIYNLQAIMGVPQEVIESADVLENLLNQALLFADDEDAKYSEMAQSDENCFYRHFSPASLKQIKHVNRNNVRRHREFYRPRTENKP